MNRNWPRVRLSQVLRRVEDVLILNDEQEYRQVTVAVHGRGLRLRQVVKGKQVKTKRQYRVRVGQFVYSRIDARNGAFGLVPPELDGAVVSNDFPSFEIDSAVADHRFIEYLTRSRWFVAQCKDPSRGVTNRQRMGEDILLSLEVPLPPLHEQRRIIEKVEAVVKRVHEAFHLREAITTEQEEMLRAYASQLAIGAPRRPLQEVAPVIRRPVTIDEATMYLELGIRSFGKGTFHKPPVAGAALGEKRLFRIEPGDLLFSNVFSWEGAIAVAQATDTGRIGSHRFITCVPNPKLATAEFLRCWLLTDEGMSYILEASPGAAGRNRTLGLKKLMAIRVPVPPLNAQKSLTNLSARVAIAQEAQGAVAIELKEITPALLDRAFSGEL